LVDRLWPRGLGKNDLRIDLWQKDIAPSTELRKWFNHDEKKWEEFKRRYFIELDKKGESVGVLVAKIKATPVILLYSAKNEKFNNAVALKEYIEIKLKKQRKYLSAV
jgi:uncharacterized protein YeaO (DUF488 family)